MPERTPAVFAAASLGSIGSLGALHMVFACRLNGLLSAIITAKINWHSGPACIRLSSYRSTLFVVPSENLKSLRVFAFMRRLDTDLAIPPLANPGRPDPDLATCPIKEAKVNRKRGIVTKCSELLSPTVFTVAFSKTVFDYPNPAGSAGSRTHP